MQSIRRTILAVTAALFALVIGSTPAFAGPPPLIEPEQGPPAEVGSSSNGFLDSWPQVTLAVLVAFALLAIAVLAMSRLRHHTAATA